MQPIEFVKLSGSGNDFICIDNRDGRYDELIAAGGGGHLAQTLCRRGTGIGADGVVFVETTDIMPGLELFARFFEPDGSEAELCGNGTACIVSWVIANGWTDDEEVRLLTSAGVVRGQLADGPYVRVCIPTPEDMATDLIVEANGRKWSCDYLVVGVPHAVTFVEDVGAVEVCHWGPLIRHHRRFQPRGVNVNFVQVIDEGEIAVRTFEFGVEDETLACGTGSAAAAIMTAIRRNWPGRYLRGDEPVRVRAFSGDVLRVYFVIDEDGSARDVCLETVVREVCIGTVCEALAAEALGLDHQAPRACSS